MTEYKGFKVGDRVLIAKKLKQEYVMIDTEGRVCYLFPSDGHREQEGKICTISYFDKEWTRRLKHPVFKLKEHNSNWLGIMCELVNSIRYLLEVRNV